MRSQVVMWEVDVSKIITQNDLLKMIQKINAEATMEQMNKGQDLFHSGIINSYTVTQLVQVLEEDLGIVFDYKDLRREYFGRFDSLFGLLTKKYGFSKGD